MPSNCQDALTFAGNSGARALQARALLSLASVNDQLRPAEDTIREATQAPAFFEVNRYAKELFQCLTLISRAERNRGNYAAALDSIQKLLKEAEQLQDKPQMSLAHESIGNVLFVEERYPAALEEFQKCVQLSVDTEHAGYGLWASGWTLWLLGRYTEAGATLDKADALGAKFADLRANILRTRADMAQSQGTLSKSVRARPSAPGLQPRPESVAFCGIGKDSWACPTRFG
ncbi:MAG TPA: tetratricopeptide repeat protein [Bryobacteraceae bacterium]